MVEEGRSQPPFDSKGFFGIDLSADELAILAAEVNALAEVVKSDGWAYQELTGLVRQIGTISKSRPTFEQLQPLRDDVFSSSHGGKGRGKVSEVPILALILARPRADFDPSVADCVKAQGLALVSYFRSHLNFHTQCNYTACQFRLALTDQKYDELFKIFGSGTNSISTLFGEIQKNVLRAKSAGPNGLHGEYYNRLKSLEVWIGYFLERKQEGRKVNRAVYFDSDRDIPHRIEEYQIEVPEDVDACDDASIYVPVYSRNTNVDEGSMDRHGAGILLRAGHVENVEPPHQNAKRRRTGQAVADSIARRSMALACEFGQLTFSEVQVVLKQVNQDLIDYDSRNIPTEDQRIAAYLLEIIFLGALDSKFDRQSVFKAKRFRCDLPDQKFRKPFSEHIIEREQGFVPEWDGDLATAFLKIAARAYPKPRKSSVSEYLNRLSKGFHRQITETYLKQYRENWFRRAGVDDAYIAWLCRAEPRDYPAAYYSLFDGSSLLEAQRNYVQYLLGQNELTVSGTLSPQRHSTGIAGTRVAPSHVYFQKFVELVGANCEAILADQKSPMAEKHNHLILYSWLLLSCATGYRAVNAPFERVSDFDFGVDWLYVEDKEIRSGHASRIVPLSDMASEQARRLISFLRNEHEEYRLLDTSAARHIQDSLSGRLPLLCVWAGQGMRQYRPLSPSWIKGRLKGAWPFEMNFGRHLLRSYLLKENVNPDLLNALMGHCHFGQESWGPFGGLSISAVGGIRPLINSYLEESGFKAIGPKATPKDEIPGIVSAYYRKLSKDERQQAEAGRKERARNRLARVDKIREKISSVVEQFAERAHAQYPQDSESIDTAKLAQEIREEFKEPFDFRIATEAASKLISKANKLNGRQLNQIDVPIRIRPRASSRNLAMFKKQQIGPILKARFDAVCESLPIIGDADPDQLLALIAVSLAYDSGVGNEETLLGAIRSLSNDEKPIVSLPSQIQGLPRCWIECSIESKTQPINDKMDERVVRQVYPTIRSLALITKFLALRNSAEKYVSDAETLLSLIRKQLNISPGEVRSISDLLNAGVWLLEHESDAQIPQALIEVNSGRAISPGITHVSLRALMVPPPGAASRRSFEEIVRKVPDSIAQVDSQQKFGSARSRDGDVLFAEIRNLIRNRKNDRSSVALLRDFENRIEAGVTINEKLLLGWYISIGTATRLKVSSIMRYHSSIGREWLVASAKGDDWRSEEGALLAICKEILSTKRKQRTQNYTLKQLKRFCKYGATVGEMPNLDWQSDGSVKSPAVVRSNLMSGEVFELVKKSIDKIVGLGKSDRTAMKQLLILAYRGGFRLGELEHLRIRDVEHSDGLIAFIRNNQLGDMKSNQSRRQVPLGVLLSAVERREFRSWLGRRRLELGSDRQSVFKFSSKFGKVARVGKAAQVIVALVREISGIDDITFHGLRHCAFSNIQLVLEGQYDAAWELARIDKSHAQNIRAAFIPNGSAGLNRYWELARLAGHTAPEMTISTYLHYSEFIVGQKVIDSSDSEILVSTFRRCSGISAQQVNKIASDGVLSSLAAENLLINALKSKVVFVQPLLTANQEDPLEPVIEKADPRLVHAMLRAVEQGQEEQTAAAEFGLERSSASWMIERARIWAELKTNRGKYRLFPSTYKKSQTRREFLAPIIPNSASEQDLAEKLIENLRSNASLGGWSSNQFINFVLSRVVSTRSGLRFKSPDELKEFLSVTRSFGVTLTWHLRIDCPKNVSPEIREGRIRHWLRKGVSRADISLREIATSSQAYHGAAELVLCSPDMSKILEGHHKERTGGYNVYSSSALKYACHMAAILMPVSTGNKTGGSEVGDKSLPEQGNLFDSV